MIAAISLMRRQDSLTLTRFRRHWLDVHGPLVRAFPGPRRYAQCHVIDSVAANEAGLSMRIDGFPILYFDNDADRIRAHHSPEMAACDVDSRLFVGAVSRVIADVENCSIRKCCGHMEAGRNIVLSWICRHAVSQHNRMLGHHRFNFDRARV